MAKPTRATTPRKSPAAAAARPPAPIEPVWHGAAAYAAFKHRHQIRKDGRTPYFAHLARVSITITGLFGHHDPETIAAALLHDTIEDTTTDFDDLAEAFGAPIASMVAALTKNAALPEAPREAEYDARLAKADWRVRLIKLADAYDNLMDTVTDPRQAESLPRRVEAAERALQLAAADAPRRREIRRGMKLLTALLKARRATPPVPHRAD